MYGQEHSGVLDNRQQDPLETYQRLKAQQDERALQNAKYLKDQLDFTQYATGLPEYDPIIHQTISDAMKDLTKKAVDPTYSQAQLMLDANNYTQKLNDYSGKVKQLRANIQSGIEQIKSPYVDKNNLLKYSILSALHDGNGSVRNINDLDPNADYVSQALGSHYDDIINGDGGIGDFIKASDKKPITTQIEKSANGIKTKSKYSGEIYPTFNRTITDPVTGVVTGIGLKSQKIKDAQGRDVDIADNDTYNLITQDKFRDAALNKIVRSQGIDPNTEAGQVAKRKALYDYLQTKGVGYLEHTGDEVDDSAFWRQQEIKSRQEDAQRFRLLLKSMNGGNQKEADTQFNNIYGELENLKGTYKTGIPFNKLSPQAQNALLGYANTSFGEIPSGQLDSQGNPKMRKLNYGDVWVKPKEDGTYSLMKSEVPQKALNTDREILPLNFEGANTLKGINSTQRERQAVRNAAPKQSTPQSSTPVYSRADLKKAGWTDDQIKIAVKAGKIKVQ